MDYEKLLPYHVTTEDRPNAVCSVPASELTDSAAMKKLLDVYAPLMKALDGRAAAAYFCNAFSGVAVALQYAISVHGQAPDVSLANLTVQLAPADGKYTLSFKLNRLAEEDVPAVAAERDEWLSRKLARFYAETVRPLIEAVAAVGGLSAPYLWGLLPTRFNYYTGQWTLHASSTAEAETIENDYAVVKRGLPAETFGLKRNPFDVTIRWLEDLKDESKQVRMKNVCCRFFETEGGYCCYTCPRLTEKERAERREQARSAAPEPAKVPVLK
ncbi:ferric iron reductase [Paenibacillus flagellatus]|uniref:Fe-S oxidoreductase n=1 Tax=Paenibacillus flagellatus TaxID=2211139 RepID=A0A2V5K2A9_9BACL|nr:ferric iron reductase [Paenibacillus flagellatus]PYI53329.1 Fe-S oxidoreductase [Paenibacillus flagellatus]